MWLEKCRANHPRYFYSVVFFVCFALIVARRADVLAYPQFWAEDGTVWYEGAYYLGWGSLFVPHTGYFQTTSRLVALTAQLLPLAYAPLFFNVIAIVVKIIPVLFIFFQRYRKNFFSILTPLVISLAYLSLPNTSEVHANITNAHWFLAITAFLILTAGKATTRVGKYFDICFLILAGLSGPFVIFLLPVAMIWWWRNRKDGYDWNQIVPVVSTVLIQVGALLLTGASRVNMALGATPSLFVKITSGQLFLGTLLGKGGYTALYNDILFANGIKSQFFYASIFLLGIFVLVWAAIKGPVRLRLFLLFTGLVYASALLKPMASATQPQWAVMMLPGNAMRYWFLPMLGFLISILFLFAKKNPRPVKFLGFCVLLIMLYGMKYEWVYDSWPNLSFATYAHKFEQLAPGETIKIPIMPETWRKMKLIKR